MRLIDVSALPRRAMFGLVALTASACSSADVSAIKAASQEQVGAVSVSEVEVVVSTPKPNPGLKVVLYDRLRNAMPICAKGNVPHRMIVTVTNFHDQNVAKSILIGDEIELAGRVELIEAASGDSVGEYFVSRSFFWGGFVGAAMMSDAEASLSDRFVESICSDVFQVDYKKET